MKGDPVPDSDHISRYCGGAQIDNGKITGKAFRLRKRTGSEEKYLSVNWLEFLKKADRDAEIEEIRKVFSRKDFQLGTQAKFAVLNVGSTRTHVRTRSPDSRDLRILHEPEVDDPSHSGIHNLRLEDELIAELIAQTVKETHPAKGS